MNTLNGSWILEKNENMDEFLKELGVNLLIRKAAKIVTPTIIISSQDKHWSIKMRSSFKNKDSEFNIGEEIDEETPDGKKIRCLYYLEGDKLVCEQRDRKTRALLAIVVKTVNQDGKMVEVLTHKHVVAKRFFKRVE
ncbi:unnamed protein product [Brachionus calyciflorus]|uniref:Lipocalin/cytosolic fatty-acid binding domain-containing protein n=1 Tax=Brachionus calyciflorus TaxID=104777 RepID=A0A814NUR7_9BILA|nr:unnamed protein product [Brachionus calyciflorus]